MSRFLAARRSSADVLCLVLVFVAVVRLGFSDVLSTPAVSAWATVFAAICVQASPFLVLGVLVSTAISVLVPESLLLRFLPPGRTSAIGVAAAAGMLLPGCECGSVPIAASLLRRRVATGPALTFLLSAPATNPVVLAATAVAFRGHPVMVLARLTAGTATAVAVGYLWSRREPPVVTPPGHEHGARIGTAHELLRSLGYLVIGAAAVATVQIALPPAWLTRMGGNTAVGAAVLGVLAVCLAVCSESDAFVAASFGRFPLTARLVFMVVGPVVDLKLIAMYVGNFGRAFAVRFLPIVFLAALASAVVVGEVML